MVMIFVLETDIARRGFGHRLAAQSGSRYHAHSNCSAYRITA